jgi:hypothetical protein
MSKDELRVRSALVDAAQEMGASMLRYRDEAQVLDDVEPSRIQFRPEALADARRAMSLARRVDLDLSITYVVNAIPKVVLELQEQLSAWCEAMVREASVTPLEHVARNYADFIVASTAVFLLPVFELEVHEHPKSDIRHADVAAAIRGYVETVDDLVAEIGPRWEEFRLRLAGRGIDDWGTFNTGRLAGAVREVMTFAYAGHWPMTFIDARVYPGGEAEARQLFSRRSDSGVLMTLERTFVAWMGGMSEGPHRIVESAVAAAGLYVIREAQF